MANRDEGALKTVGWGPFALPGERKRLRAAEERRLAEVEATSAPDDAASSSSEAITPAMSLQRINEMLRSKSTEVMWLCNVSRLHLTKLGDASDQEIRD